MRDRLDMLLDALRTRGLRVVPADPGPEFRPAPYACDARPTRCGECAAVCPYGQTPGLATEPTRGEVDSAQLTAGERSASVLDAIDRAYERGAPVDRAFGRGKPKPKKPRRKGPWAGLEHWLDGNPKTYDDARTVSCSMCPWSRTAPDVQSALVALQRHTMDVHGGGPKGAA